MRNQLYHNTYYSKFILIVISLALSFSTNLFASQYTVSSAVNASALASRLEDTLYIDNVVTLSSNQTWNFSAVIMRGSSSSIFWTNNSNLSLPYCTLFNIETGTNASQGLEPTGGNASKVLVIAGTKVAVSNDNSSNAAFSFEEFTYLGGLPKFSVTTNSPLCNGNPLVITVTPDRVGSIAYNYNWTISPVSGTFNPTSATSTSPVSTTISPAAGTYSVTCKIYATGDLLATTTNAITINSLPSAPTSVSASPSAICVGASSNLSATSAGNTIQWYTASSGGSAIGSSNSAANFSVTSSASQTYYAESVASSGCKSSSRTSLSLTVNALPTIFSVTGGGNYCAGGSGVQIGLSGSESGVNYQLYNGASAVGSSFAGTGVTINFGYKSSSGSYTVVATKVSTNCTADMSGNATVTIMSRPSSSISNATQNICNGSTAAFNVSLSGTAPWSLTYSDGTTSTLINNIASSPYIVSVSPSSTKTYFITVLSDLNCPAINTDLTGTALINVNQRPTSTLSQANNICKGSSATLSIAVTGTGTISGQLSDGTSFSGTAPTINVNVSPVNTTYYTVASLNDEKCSAINTDLAGSATITVIDLVPVSVVNQPLPVIYCDGSDASFNVSASGASPLAYQWQVKENGGIYRNVSGEIYEGATTSILTIHNASSSLHLNYYRAIVNSTVACAVADTSSPAKLSLTNYWTGTTSNDWNTTTNWSGNIVPGIDCADVFIGVGNPYPPTLIEGTASIHNLVIKPGALLTINSTMNISGTITNQGTFNVTQGSIEFNGSVDQYLSANVFYNNTIKEVIISNNVSLQGPASITGRLSFGSSGKTFATNGYLTLKSTANNTASVDQVINGNNITGEVTVERYINQKRAWRLLAIPTKTTQCVKAAWQEGAESSGSNNIAGYGTQVTNNTTTWLADGFDYYSPDGPSLKKYSPQARTYISIPNTYVGIATDEGWLTFIRGDRTAIGLSAVATPTTLRTKGELYIGTQPTLTIPAGLFKSVNNPYASAVDMRRISKTGITNNFYIWDANLGNGLGGFQTFSLGNDGNYRPTPGGGSYSSSSTPYNYIQSGMAFFVVGSPLPSSNGSITFSEDAKVSSGNISFFRAPSKVGSEASLTTNLYLNENKTELSLLDGALNIFADNYNNGIDQNDAGKMISIVNVETIAIVHLNNTLSIEKRQNIKAKDTINFNLQNIQQKHYRIELVAKDFRPALRAFLYDKLTIAKTEVNMNSKTIYDFDGVKDMDNQNRFSIVFENPSAGNSIDRIKLFTDKKSTIAKPFAVYPNPIQNGTINIKMMGHPKGIYSIRLLDKIGQVIISSSVDHNESNNIETLILYKKIPHGIYQLEIAKPDESLVKIKIVY